MIFISAGHSPKAINRDAGASGNGYREGDLTIELRDMIIEELIALKQPFIADYDTETLSEYLRRISTGTGSVILELHFDAASSEYATGCTGIVEEEADRLDKLFAAEIALTTSKCLGIRNRGVIPENQTHRGRLGLMREEGIICLLEVGFITNKADIEAYQCSKRALAMVIAPILVKYEKLV